jgi:hypothetical protein
VSKQPTKLETLLTEAAKLRIQMEAFVPLQNRLDELKFEIQQELAALKSKRSEPVHGIYAIRQERKTFRIYDPKDAEAWLVAAGAELDTLQKLDSKAVEGFVKSNFRETGELPDGMGYDTTEFVSIRQEDTTPSLKDALS